MPSYKMVIVQAYKGSQPLRHCAQNEQWRGHDSPHHPCHALQLFQRPLNTFRLPG